MQTLMHVEFLDDDAVIGFEKELTWRLLIVDDEPDVPQGNDLRFGRSPDSWGVN